MIRERMSADDLCTLARAVLGRRCRVHSDCPGGVVVIVEGVVTREQREAVHHFSRDYGNLIIVGTEKVS